MLWREVNQQAFALAAVVVVVADVEARVQICTFVRGRTVPFEKRSKKGPSCWVVVVGGGLLALEFLFERL